VDKPRLREPEQIRQDCAAKFIPVMDGVAFAAILVGEDRIEPIIVSDDRVLARTEGQARHALILGARKCLIRQVLCTAKMAGLDGDELGYLLAAIAKIKRVE